MGLYNELINQRIKRVQEAGQFWGDFEDLNNVKASNIKKFQQDQIKGLYKQEKKYSNSLKFMQAVNQPILYNEIEENTINKIIIKIINLLNSPFRMSGKEEKIEQEHMQMQKNLQELLRLIDLIKPGQKIPENIAKAFEAKAEMWTQQDFVKKYVQIKSDYLEYLAVLALEKAMGGTFKAIQTGSFYYQGQQMSQDVIGIDYDINLSSGSVTSRKSGTKRKKKDWGIISSTEEFLTKLKEKTKEEGKISVFLNDEFQEIVNKQKTLRVQVKSGINQSILNTSVKNSISLETFENSTFSKLMNLYKINNGYWFYSEEEQNSATLDSIAILELTKYITKTQLLDNEIYLTEKGFMTGSELLFYQNKMLKFDKPIKVNSFLLVEKRHYGIHSV